MAKIVWGFADYVIVGELNTSLCRVFIPAELLGRAGHTCHVYHLSLLMSDIKPPEAQQAIDEADVIVIERLIVGQMHQAIRDWRKAGKRVIVTFDDHYGLMPKDTGSWEFWHSNGGSNWSQFLQGLRLVDKAITPSKVLCDDFKDYCPTEFVPNYLHPQQWTDVPRRPPDRNIIIGWCGSSAHDQSWLGSDIVPALGSLNKKHPRLHVHIQNTRPAIVGLLNKHQVRFNAQDWVPAEHWPRVVAAYNIGIAPLSGEYDRRRSYNKLCEYATLGIPWVATKYHEQVGPYDETVGGILIENHSHEWERALSMLIEDEPLRQNLGQQGYVWSKQLMDNAVKDYERALGL